jgi:uncharacterized membrane protein
MFSMAHLHLLVNHFPIIGSIFILILFLIALAFKQGFLQKLSLWFLAGTALSTAVAYVSGDGTKHAIKNLPEIPDSMITAHEQAARYGLVIMFLAGIVSVGGILFYSKRSVLPLYLRITVLLILLVSVAVLAYVGFLGGQIMHPEIRALTTAPFTVG